MKKSLLTVLLFAAVVAGVYAPSVDALGLKVAPLEYPVALKKGEKQKGFIDLSNPAGVSVRVKTSVQAFEQTDDKGTLRFFDDEAVSRGVKTDLDEFELGPREAIRMYFLVDGSELPSGDVFAAIFFTTQPAAKGTGVTELVRLGTILSIVNGTPSGRRAEISRLDIPSFQFGDMVRGSYAVKNTSNPQESTGFYPAIVLAVDPFHEEKVVKSRLVFADRTRTNSFELNTSRIGLHKISVSYGANTKEKWVLILNAPAVMVLCILVAGGAAFWWLKRRRQNPVDNLRINR